MIILAIESSCDDTSVAIMKDQHLLSLVTASQQVHEEYGGVVPELASRAHLSHIIPTVDRAIKQANIELIDIDAIAVTRGPGLLGSLIVGVSVAKGLAAALDVPIVEVHHMHAHIMSNFIESPKPSFPFISLTVSGGHSQLSIVKSPLDYEIVGNTIDDAAGEAFDKIGKIMGLPYPAGPEIDRLSKMAKQQAAYKFPQSNLKGYDYSFSGLKTSVMYFLRDHMKQNDQFINENINEICASVQTAIVGSLCKKLKLLSENTGIKEIAISGGVSANSGLREAVSKMAVEQKWTVHFPKLSYCTDNAAMIAICAHYLLEAGEISDLSIAASARM